jgi:hypothetical protein
MKRSLVCWLWACASACHAGLGDAPALLGHNLNQRSVTQAQGSTSVTYRETVLSTGTVVHEYLDSAGTVYAVTWKGPFQPDLKALLGSYFQVLTTANASGRKGMSGLHIVQNDFVLTSSGQMGALDGKAWLPPKLPTGVTVKNLK